MANATITCCFQARRLLCDRLALLLSFRTTASPTDVNVRERKSSSKIRRNRDRVQDDADQSAAANSASSSQTLTSILDLLERRIFIEDEDRQRSDQNAKVKRDWMLAAAVIDRLTFIVLTVMFAGGTLVFIVLLVQS